MKTACHTFVPQMAKKMLRYILVSCMLLLGVHGQLSARSYRESTLSAVSHLKNSERPDLSQAGTAPFIHSIRNHRAPIRATLPFSENEEKESDEDEETKSSEKQNINAYFVSALSCTLADTLSDKKAIPDFSHYHLSALSELYLVFGVFRL